MENGSSLGHLHVTCVIFPNNLSNYWRVYVDYFGTGASKPRNRTSVAEGIDVRPAFFCVILYVVLCCGCWDLRAARYNAKGSSFSKGSGWCDFHRFLRCSEVYFGYGSCWFRGQVGSQSFKPLLEWPHWLTFSNRSEVCFWNSETQHDRRAPEKEKWDCAIGFTQICVFFLHSSEIPKSVRGLNFKPRLLL